MEPSFEAANHTLAGLFLEPVPGHGVELGLMGLSTFVALWVWLSTGSLFLSLWCFFLMQALFVFIPGRPLAHPFPDPLPERRALIPEIDPFEGTIQERVDVELLSGSLGVPGPDGLGELLGRLHGAGLALFGQDGGSGWDDDRLG